MAARSVNAEESGNEPTVADIVYEGTSRRVYYLKYARPVYAMITQFISTVKIYSVHANPSVITYSYVTFSCVKKTLRYVPGAVDVILVEKTCVRRTCYCKRRAKMYTLPGSPRTLPPTFLRRASSWSRMPLAVVSTITPNYERQKDG